METAINWNQTPQPIKASILVGLTFEENDRKFFGNLTRRLEEIIRASEVWRETPQNSRGYDWCVYNPTVKGLLATYDLGVPIECITPSQLRAFCTHVNRFAEKLHEENIAGVKTVISKIDFLIYQMYE